MEIFNKVYRSNYLTRQPQCKVIFAVNGTMMGIVLGFQVFACRGKFLVCNGWHGVIVNQGNFDFFFYHSIDNLKLR